MKTRTFGKLRDGRAAGLYILRNSNGMEASLTDYGASLVSLIVPDKSGRGIDVVLGHDDAAGYEEGHGSIGATVGRFANRIGGAAFALNGMRYELTANNGPNCLHGGRDPYSKRLWSVRVPFTSISSKDVAAKQNAAESISDKPALYIQDDVSGDTVTFVLDSPDGDQGFPGNLHIEVTYTLTNDNELHIDYRASSDADTPLNLTNHSYFDLNGHDGGTVLGHHCLINAGAYTPNDETGLPTGEIREVGAGVGVCVTVTESGLQPIRGLFDFRVPKVLGEGIVATVKAVTEEIAEAEALRSESEKEMSAAQKDVEQIRLCGGYDHNFLLDGEGYREAAVLSSAESGICMKVLTDMPGLQLYTANGLTDEPGKGGCVYGPRSGVCFETQFWPDSVNRENFPGGILRAGEEFHSRTTYRF